MRMDSYSPIPDAPLNPQENIPKPSKKWSYIGGLLIASGGVLLFLRIAVLLVVASLSSISILKGFFTVSTLGDIISLTFNFLIPLLMVVAGFYMRRVHEPGADIKSQLQMKRIITLMGIFIVTFIPLVMLYGILLQIFQSDQSQGLQRWDYAVYLALASSFVATYFLRIASGFPSNISRTISILAISFFLDMFLSLLSMFTFIGPGEVDNWFFTLPPLIHIGVAIFCWYKLRDWRIALVLYIALALISRFLFGWTAFPWNLLRI